MKNGNLANYIAKFSGVSKAAAETALHIILAAAKTRRAGVNRGSLDISRHISSNFTSSRLRQRVFSSSKITGAIKTKSRKSTLKKVLKPIVRQPTFHSRVNYDVGVNKVNKSQLVNQVMVSARVSKAEANRAFDGAIEVLQKENNISLVGFGDLYFDKDIAPTGQEPGKGMTIKFKVESPKTGKARKNFVTDTNSCSYKVVKLFLEPTESTVKEQRHRMSILQMAASIMFAMVRVR